MAAEGAGGQGARAGAANAGQHLWGRHQSLCHRDRPVPPPFSGHEGVRHQTTSNVPGFHIHLAVGDSLLHAPLQGGQLVFDFELSSGDDECEHAYQSEDLPILKQMLRGNQYHAVVANPPYITPKDRQLNERYRQRFKTCHMKYSLGPSRSSKGSSGLAVDGGYTGQITANSFMKREIRQELIESFFTEKIDLTHVIDTSGALHPGSRYANGDSLRPTSPPGVEHVAGGDGDSG